MSWVETFVWFFWGWWWLVKQATALFAAGVCWALIVGCPIAFVGYVFERRKQGRANRNA